MSMSGIEIDSETKDQFDNMKLRKKWELLVLEIKDKKKVVVCDDLSREKCTNAEFQEFLKSVQDRCFYIIYDYKETETKTKLMMVSWVPDTAKVTEKMVYASTKEALKSKFDGIKFRVQASDITDADDKVLMERAKKA